MPTRRLGIGGIHRPCDVGRLATFFWERCRLDPKTAHGDRHGAACIEIHHAAVQVSEMTGDGHATRLEDLQWLCANCHWVVHWLLKEADNGREKRIAEERGK